MIIRRGMGDGKEVESDQREDRKAQRILSLGDKGKERGGGLNKRFTDWIIITMERFVFSENVFPSIKGKR
jgi:hypothetical protein